MTQKELISKLLKSDKPDVIVGSLGTISKDIDGIPYDGEKHLIRGAMGCAIGVGLGYALSSKKNVLVIIGDGSTLMKMGSLATILKYKPKNLSVAIINNRSYKSCGGQPTVFKYVEDLLSNDGKSRYPRSYKVFKISSK